LSCLKLASILLSFAFKIMDEVTSLNSSRIAVIGGSSTNVSQLVTFSVETPFGSVASLSFLDPGKMVVFVPRHYCVSPANETGKFSIRSCPVISFVQKFQTTARGLLLID
jgi:hypothetical protein